MWPCHGSGGQLLPVMAWPFIFGYSHIMSAIPTDPE
jgi:hypothetical protein